MPQGEAGGQGSHRTFWRARVSPGPPGPVGPVPPALAVPRAIRGRQPQFASGTDSVSCADGEPFVMEGRLENSGAARKRDEGGATLDFAPMETMEAGPI